MNEVYRKRLDQLFFFCLVLSVAALPFSMKLSSLSIFALVACWLFRDSLREKWKRANNPMLWLFLSFYFLHVVGLIWTENIQNGFWELERKSSMLVFPIVLGTTRPLGSDAVNRLLKYFVGTVIATSIVCLVYAAYRVITLGRWSETDPQTLYTIHYFFYDGLSEMLIQPMYFSAYVVFSICIVVYLTRSWKQPLAYILVLYLLIFLFMLSARIMIAALFALLVINTFVMFVARGKVRMAVLAAAGAMTFLALLINVAPPLRDRVTSVFNSTFEFRNDPATNMQLSGKLDDVNMRLAKWYFTIEAGTPTWFVGQGTGDDMDALIKTYRDNNFAEGYVPKYNSHNQYLQTWLGLGIPGVLILIAMFSVPAVQSLKRSDLLYFSLIVLLALFCVTESVFCRQYGVVFYACFNSLLAFHRKGSLADLS